MQYLCNDHDLCMLNVEINLCSYVMVYCFVIDVVKIVSHFLTLYREEYLQTWPVESETVNLW